MMSGRKNKLDYEIRKDRFQKFRKSASLEFVSDLIARHKISQQKYDALVNSILDYLRAATGQSEVDEKNFESIELFNLRNITPNGAIVPKREYEAAYNLALKAYYDIIAEVFTDKSLFGRIHFPVNFRLKTGIPDPRNEGRGLNTAIPHSDAWVGEDSGGFNLFLPVLGDISKNRLRYYSLINPEEFQEAWLSPVDSYLEHLDIIQKYSPCDRIVAERGYVYISDFAVIHETHVEHGAGNRLSCDTGVYIAESLQGTIRHNDRDDEYIDYIPCFAETHYANVLQSESDPITTKETHFSHYAKRLIRLNKRDVI